VRSRCRIRAVRFPSVQAALRKVRTVAAAVSVALSPLPRTSAIQHTDSVLGVGHVEDVPADQDVTVRTAVTRRDVHGSDLGGRQ
jgi:hypothetical protein